MIKINLLQVRKEKKKIGIRKEIIVLILSLVLLFVGLFLVQWKTNKDKEATLAQISKTKEEITRYKSLTKDLEVAKQTQKILQDKMNVINTLRKQKSGPAKVLDELSIDKPEKVYFESVKKDGSNLGIEGIALDDETVANFMTNLRKSKLFKKVDLIVSESTELSKFKLKKFILSCEIILM
jgi:type IV pilus assembly protein PilN